METNANNNFSEPTTNIIDEFGKLSGYLRENVEKFVDTNAKALFGISAEIIDGLQKPFTDFEKKNEPVWE